MSGEDLVETLRPSRVEHFVRERLYAAERAKPIVGVSTRLPEDEPLIDAWRLAVELGDAAEVVLLRTGRTTDALNGVLPPRMGVFGGAVRVWWPGLRPVSTPEDHPLHFVWTNEDAERVAERILRSILGPEAAAEVLSEPATLLVPEVVASEEELALARRLEHVEAERDRLARELRELRRREQELRKRLRLVKENGGGAAFELDPLRSPAAFLAALHRTIDQLHAGGDQGLQPQLVRLHPRFLESARDLEGISTERLLQVCAHVVSGHAAHLHGLQVHPLRSGEGGAEQRVRAADGARAWRCSLQVNTPSARRLHWWSLPGVAGGALELAVVGVHDSFDIPE